jgi:hypothetical protein
MAQQQIDMKNAVITALKKILAEVEAYAVLPEPASPECQTMGDQWDIKFDALTEKKRRAVNLARLVLPPEVEAVLDSIDKAAFERQQGIGPKGELTICPQEK